MVTADGVHMYEATLGGTLGVELTLHAATLPLASNTAGLPAVTVAGRATAAMGLCAALTALSALTIPAPHWVPSFGQAHSPLFASLAGHTGRPVGWGNRVALDLILAINCGGVRFALTARIRAAIPDTMGAEKLVPRLTLLWSV